MKTNLYHLICGLCFMLGLSLAGCRDKQETPNPVPDVTAETDESNRDAFIESVFNDVQQMADEAALTGNINQRTASTMLTCATVTRDTIGFPRVVTIDFGPVNCTGPDGRERRGKVIINFTGPYRQQGTVITVGFDNYFVNNNQVLGSKTISNHGPNATTGFPEFSIVVNGQIISANADTATWQANRTRTWTAGFNTLILADDVYEITGSASGTRASGQTYSNQILTPLVRKLAPGCRRHFVSGTILISPANKPDRLLDYGNGLCDNIATITINGVTHTITLP